MKTFTLVLLLCLSFSCFAQDAMYDIRPVNLRYDERKEVEYKTGKRLLVAGVSALLIGSTVRWAIPQFLSKPQFDSPTLAADASEFLYRTRQAVNVGSGVMALGGAMIITGGIKMRINRRLKVEADF